MNEILNQVGQLFVQSAPTVIFVFILFLVLDRLFFKPLLKVLADREEATQGAIARARKAAVEAEEEARKYEAALQAARQDVYRLREQNRRSMNQERSDALGKTRQEAELLIKQADADLKREMELAKSDLTSRALELAGEISKVILGPQAGDGGRLAQ